MRNDINSIANKNYRYKFSNARGTGSRPWRHPLTRILVKKSLLIICIRQRVGASFLSDSTMQPAPRRVAGFLHPPYGNPPDESIPPAAA
ncbi:hypothetical protein BCEN4_350123 [Burkholderia cenocepacia]|nr:hypothetical protein BCEN4_350123 [Burkholderia cenocepacia]